MFILILLWLVACAMPSLIALRKGKSALFYFLLSLVLTPFIGVLVALFSKPQEPAYQELVAMAPEARTCLFCGKRVDEAAMVCPFCNRELPPPDVS